MTTTVLLALGISMAIYLAIGFRYKRTVKGLGDILPIFFGGTAHVKNHQEFSASTVAATISLATVIVAFFELVPALGLWLLWPAVTTALGLLFFGLIVKKIWSKMATYDHRPTLHEFLGTEFNSKTVALVGAVCTTVGYLSAFAVELTVGSRFLAALLPQIPEFLTVVILSMIAFIYTGMGGFRTVVVTDRIQMWSIWLLLFAVCLFFAVVMAGNGVEESIKTIPEALRTLRWNGGLTAFVWGILIMNLFTYVSNMGLWQRIAGSENPDTVVKGMWSSVIQSAISWSFFVVIAVGAFMIISPVEGENVLITLLKAMQNTVFGQAVIFCVIIGLYGAMLSTASTQLIAVSHTIYEDIIAPFRSKGLRERADSKIEVFRSRFILVGSALVAIGVVELLRLGGFTVADLAFAVYGAALGLVPPVLFTLFLRRGVSRQLSIPATFAVILGFLSSWVAASLGKATGDGNLVFLSPIFSTVVSTIIMVVGWLFVGRKAEADEIPTLSELQLTSSLEADVLIDPPSIIGPKPILYSKSTAPEWERRNGSRFLSAVCLYSSSAGIVSPRNLERFHFNFLSEKSFGSLRFAFLEDATDGGIQRLQERFFEELSEHRNPLTAEEKAKVTFICLSPEEIRDHQSDLDRLTSGLLAPGDAFSGYSSYEMRKGLHIGFVSRKSDEHHSKLNLTVSDSLARRAIFDEIWNSIITLRQLHS